MRAQEVTSSRYAFGSVRSFMVIAIPRAAPPRGSLARTKPPDRPHQQRHAEGHDEVPRGHQGAACGGCVADGDAVGAAGPRRRVEAGAAGAARGGAPGVRRGRGARGHRRGGEIPGRAREPRGLDEGAARRHDAGRGAAAAGQQRHGALADNPLGDAERVVAQLGRARAPRPRPCARVRRPPAGCAHGRAEHGPGAVRARAGDGLVHRERERARPDAGLPRAVEGSRAVATRDERRAPRCVRRQHPARGRAVGARARVPGGRDRGGRARRAGDVEGPRAKDGVGGAADAGVRARAEPPPARRARGVDVGHPRGDGRRGPVPHRAAHGVGRERRHLRGGARQRRAPCRGQAAARRRGAGRRRLGPPAARGGGAGPRLAPQRGRRVRAWIPRGRDLVPRDGAAPRRDAGGPAQKSKRLLPRSCSPSRCRSATRSSPSTRRGSCTAT